jgi:putative ABC transport system permease protein
MNLWSAISIGFKEIWAHKFRSLLTMLGIILGASSLIAMSALVKGREVAAKEALMATGGLQKIRIEPQDVPVYQWQLKDQAVGVTINDAYALQASAPLVAKISPEMRLFNPTASRKGKSFRPWVCSGVWPVALEMSEHVVQYGRMFNEIDDEMARNVCVIGTGVRDELFGSPEDGGEEINPVGETININGQPFTIIGLFQHYESEQERKERELAKLQPKPAATGPKRSRGWSGRAGGGAFRMKNNTLFMPLNTVWMKFRAAGAGASGSKSKSASGDTLNVPDPRLSVLEVKIGGVSQLNAALQQIRNVLMATHKGIEDFSFRTQEEWMEEIDTFIHNARISGGIIAGISLLVGGIGIMNIMLASISERVREIGIRKAVGAATGDVFIQILVESVVIAVLGGLAGLIASRALVRVIMSFSPTEIAPIITLTAMTIAFLFSVGVGVLAGLFPAVKAARLDPIQALRYE